jgi:hypothetical protein
MWEPLLYYAAVSFMSFLFLSVLSLAYLESDRILKCALIAMAAPVPSDSKQNCSSSHKNGDGKSCTGKVEGVGSWNLGSSVQQTEKHMKASQSSNNSVGLCSKNNSSTEPDHRSGTNEVDSKEKSGCVKYDEPEMGLSNSSAPISAVRNKKKLGKRNSSNSETSSLSESLLDIPVLKKSWGSVFSRSGQGSSVLKCRQVDTEIKATMNIANFTDMQLSAKKNMEVGKDGKKINQEFKENKIQPEAMVCSEEETSSTTTESSNNDEMEKVSYIFTHTSVSWKGSKKKVKPSP